MQNSVHFPAIPEAAVSLNNKQLTIQRNYRRAPFALLPDFFYIFAE